MHWLSKYTYLVAGRPELHFCPTVAALTPMVVTEMSVKVSSAVMSRLVARASSSLSL